ncbi:hypothetical protein DYB25_003299 [Aphanomyces astaci]|uniref:Myb-like domain-containing protein n=1 Tax=Aphanomyces astaci TaxID=112090 RepID=A0A396ZXT2_APHAT|nr:hypothetical protein DYB25_003299 [Aphanomyces astaci]RHY13348.1 hypothetical protein DYB36_006536 [Aphanomyces astaci]RHY53919.1 hypothetical protein DYB38_006927 [Aphanomyces astaci]RHZ16619.1 hypothetical protein DYB26_016387 [Aphanomyces astaci]
METPQRRRVFNEKEDVMLLRQVNADRPFQAKKGEVMKSWASVAHQLAEHDDFGRPSFDAKKALNRFGILMDGHVQYNAESARASGVSEDHDERILLLDELLAAYTDSKFQDKARHEQVVADQEKNEGDGMYIRNEAMQTMGKRKSLDDDFEKASGAGGRFMKITTVMQEDAKADRELRKDELEFRKYKYDKELEERQKDRELASQQSRLQHETILAMLAAMKK